MEPKTFLFAMRFILFIGTISGSEPCAIAFAGMSIGLSIETLG